MDYMQRAKDVRNQLNKLLVQSISNSFPSGYTEAQVLLHSVQNRHLAEQATAILVVDAYIRFLEEAPATSNEEAATHFIYALEDTNQTSLAPLRNSAVLRYQLMNPEYHANFLEEDNFGPVTA